MNTKRIKATYTMLPLIGCPGAEGASWALPADAESYERMVEQIKRHWMIHPCGPTTTHLAQNALRAIGIVPPVRLARKGQQKGRK